MESGSVDALPRAGAGPRKGKRSLSPATHEMQETQETQETQDSPELVVSLPTQDDVPKDSPTKVPSSVVGSGSVGACSWCIARRERAVRTISKKVDIEMALREFEALIESRLSMERPLLEMSLDTPDSCKRAQKLRKQITDLSKKIDGLKEKIKTLVE